jgi:hypothetical protein
LTIIFVSFFFFTNHSFTTGLAETKDSPPYFLEALDVVIILVGRRRKKED